MGVQSAVNIDDLTGHIAALVRCEIDAHMSDIFGASVTVHHDVAQENVL